MATKTRTRGDYTVGWICASTERRAAMAMLDELHEPLPTPEYDRNIYTLGSIGKHNVVIACQSMRSTTMDTVAIVYTFPSIKFNLLVGIGSGIPPNVRLGDVVVGTGVTERVLSNRGTESVARTQLPKIKSQLLLATLAKIKTEQQVSGLRISQYLERLKQDSPELASGYLQSGSLKDLLFEAAYSHVARDLAGPNLVPSDDDDDEEESCRFCDKAMVINRKPREMLVHYGSIFTTSQEVKNAFLRDEINRDLGGDLLCIETGVARRMTSLLSHFPCAIIRGICNYADSHSNKDWQKHAAIIAAAYAKDFLQYVSAEDLDGELSMNVIIGQTIFPQVPPTQQPMAPAALPKADEYQFQNPRPAPQPPEPGSGTTFMPPVPHPGSSSEYPLLSQLQSRQAPPIPPLGARAPPPPPRSQHYAPNFPPWMPFSYNEGTEVHAAVSTDETDDLLAKPILPSEQDLQILEWLTPVDYGPRHRDLLSRWQPETGLWLLDSAEYRTWLNRKKRTLFCPGDIGTGKTILTSAVINDVKTRFQTDPTAGIAYIYCDRRHQETQQVDDLIASILKQLTQRMQSLPNCLRQMYEKHEHGQTRPSLDEILEALHTMIGEYSRVFIIVDALDECPTSSGCRQTFLKELSNLQNQFGVNCFATSRLDPDIIAHFRTNSISLEIRENAKDVQLYVKRYMEQLPAFTELDQRQQETMLVKVLEHVDKSFLSAAIFVHLLEETLQKEPSITRAVEDMLKANPEWTAEGEAEAEASIQILYKLEQNSKQQGMVTESNTVRNEEAWATDLSSRGQFSDSGYASMPRDLAKRSEYSKNEAIMEETYNMIAESESNNVLEELASTDQTDNMTDDTDDRTEYSAATSLGDSRIERLVSQLADQLIGEVCLDGLDDQSMETVFSTLQDLLKSFALKIGFNAQSQLTRDIMYYTHKYSRNIARLLETRLSNRDQDRDQFSNRIAPELSQEMTRDWLDNLDDLDEPEPYNVPDNQYMEEDLEIDHPDQGYEEDGETNAFDLSTHRDLISASAAYHWLLVTLRRESLLELKCSNMGDIRQTIIYSLKASQKISRSRPAEAFRTTFLINWDPIAFLKEQLYDESPEEAIDKVITLTGSAKNALALTTVQYLRHTWPTTGEYVLQLVKNVLRGSRGEKYTGRLPEGTELTAWNTETDFMVEAFGTAASIAEIGEQLAWLSASLRSSCYDTGIAFVTPSLHILDPENATLRTYNPNVQYRFEYVIEKGEKNSLDNGECWHNLFRNPVLVKGFPVLRRPKPQVDTGLELPLNMMAALTNTQRIDEFNGGVFIKGFSAMLIPTNFIEGVIIWHLQYRADGDHISYFDACVPHTSINASDIEQSRNIVGWCSQADLFAGANEAKYNVQRSGLPRPTADCVLHNISISAGKYITGGVNFAMGVKDHPIHLVRGSYMPKLEWIHKKFVVLWDERYKRGWLVNGTTALLHLSRAALKRKQESPFRSLLLFKPGSMEEATERLTAESAVQVLTNERNMKLKIYRDKSQHNERVVWRGTEKETVVYEEEKFYRFQDLVDDLYNVLEKMVEYQHHVTNRDGVSLKCRIRKHLDGWEFDDIVENQDCRPSVATLEAMGYGWVNLITEIGAVTLLGRDFGEIIQPSGTEMLCDRWSQMPMGGYFLGACVSDLANIIRSHGNEEQLRLTNNISWHNRPFESCRCHRASSSKHSYLVQELSKSKDDKRLKSNDSNGNSGSKAYTTASLELRGAVIFSHNYQLASKQDDVEKSTRSTKSKPLLDPEASTGDGYAGPSRIQLLVEGNESNLSLDAGQLTPMLESATSEHCDSQPGLHESQTEASIDDSLATSISNVQGLSVSKDSSNIIQEKPLATAPVGRENDGIDSRQGKGRLGRWRHFKQRFSHFSKK